MKVNVIVTDYSEREDDKTVNLCCMMFHLFVKTQNPNITKAYQYS